MKRESICVLLTPLTHYLHGVKVYKHQCLTFLQHSSGPLSRDAHASPSSIYQAVITICSLCSPCSRLSHLVNPKGEACRCTTTSLNPLPLFLTLPPLLSVVVAVQTTPESSATPPSPEHKGRIYQYVLVTFRGQCCCSWITEVQLCISRSLGVSAP